MKSIYRVVLLLALATLPAGCLAAAAAAGAGGAIAYNERGAQSMVNGSVGDVAADTRAVFRDMGITFDGEDAEADGDVVVRGTRGGMSIRVEIERESNTTTEVMVTAREGTLDFDRPLSRDILSRIIARS